MIKASTRNNTYATNTTGLCPWCSHVNARGNVCAHFHRTGLDRGGRTFVFKLRHKEEASNA